MPGQPKNLRENDPDEHGLISDIHEELNEFEFDLAAQRENRRLRAGRILATVESALHREFAEELRRLGHEDLAKAHELMAERREIQSVSQGYDVR